MALEMRKVGFIYSQQIHLQLGLCPRTAQRSPCPRDFTPTFDRGGIQNKMKIGVK